MRGYCGCWCSVAQSCLTLCNPINCSTPGSPVLHYLLESAQRQAPLSCTISWSLLRFMSIEPVRILCNQLKMGLVKFAPTQTNAII